MYITLVSKILDLLPAPFQPGPMGYDKVKINK